jgi:hypothetical protein
MKKLLVVLGFATFATSVLAESPIKPDAKLTPGVVNTKVTPKEYCVSGYTGQPGVRNVPESVKKQVFAAYKIDPKSDKYEIDHLISLELGGANDVKNLWPQSYTTKPLNAHTKDALENKLHKLICDGKVNAADVQKDVAADWTAAYTKYVGPLPK